MRDEPVSDFRALVPILAIVLGGVLAGFCLLAGIVVRLLSGAGP